jgi:hypothetical protein
VKKTEERAASDPKNSPTAVFCLETFPSAFATHFAFCADNSVPAASIWSTNAKIVLREAISGTDRDFYAGAQAKIARCRVIAACLNASRVRYHVQ